MNRVLLPIFALLAVTAVSLSAQPSRPANCYIVAPGATLEFNGRLQGCSADTIEGDPAQAGVLWESAGADIKVKEGDVVASATFSQETGIISVKAGKTPGNALVVIEDAVSNVLWSWHIWVTDYDPSKNCYQQDAKGNVIMMDRNLGALSATPGDPLSLGLFYQWGRKDPFPGPVSVDGAKEARNTYRWPKPVESDNYTGTVEYTRYNPVTFLLWSDPNCDWLFTGEPSADNTRWAEEMACADFRQRAGSGPRMGRILPRNDFIRQGGPFAQGLDSCHRFPQRHRRLLRRSRPLWLLLVGVAYKLSRPFAVFRRRGNYQQQFRSVPRNCPRRALRQGIIRL